MTASRPRLLLGGLLLAVLGLGVLPGAAAADPKPTLNEVQRKVDGLNRQAEQAAERYNTAKVDLTEANRRLHSVQNRYRVTQRRLRRSSSWSAGSPWRPTRPAGSTPACSCCCPTTPTSFLRQASTSPRSTAARTDAARHGDARLQAAADRKAVAEQRARAADLQQQIAAEKRTVEARLADGP